MCCIGMESYLDLPTMQDLYRSMPSVGGKQADMLHRKIFPNPWAQRASAWIDRTQKDAILVVAVWARQRKQSCGHFPSTDAGVRSRGSDFGRALRSTSPNQVGEQGDCCSDVGAWVWRVQSFT